VIDGGSEDEGTEDVKIVVNSLVEISVDNNVLEGG
jgi:hypothetical protein